MKGDLVCNQGWIIRSEGRKWRQDIGFGGVSAKERDGGDAVGGEGVGDVVGQVMADGGGRQGDARSPLFDEGVDVGEAVVAAILEIVDEFCGGDRGEGFGADGPYGGDPWKSGAGVPFVGEVEPEAWADGWVGFDPGAGFESQQRRVADE